MYRFFLLLSVFFHTVQVQSGEEHAFHQDIYIEAKDGVRLRLAYIPAKDDVMTPETAQTVVVFVPGRTSCVENNYDFALRLAGHASQSSKESFDFWGIDNRGHGKSGGRLEIDDGIHDQRCHIDSFETYSDDLHQALGEIEKRYEGRKADYVLVGMSMGGNIVLNYLREYNMDLAIPLKRAVLISPMVKFLTPGFPELGAFALANVATYLGFGEWFIPGHGSRDLRDEAVEKYTGSHNKEDFLRQQAFFRRHPSMITEGATYGWIKAAFDAVTALGEMQESPVPISAFLAGDDRHVDTIAAVDFLTRLKAKIFVYDEAFHVLTREPEVYIPHFWEELFEEISKE
ncbi:MAG: alpha/beta hydrolase [Alphaproteobacteria bacterium]|nr:alpha/beta hydrolase [Alphaproteobacteria bacterium]NCQ67676.1 alpha/beta hydrolase [Alphaproteobacteria bacterium]NCT07562.1 alpha/beta hydrolase [Alphaproteobacteria bacterium]